MNRLHAIPLCLRLRIFDQAYGSYDGLLHIVRHVRVSISHLLNHSRPVVGTPNGIVERRHVRLELYRRYFVLGENRSNRQRRHGPGIVFDGVPRIRYISFFYQHVIVSVLNSTDIALV